MADPNPQTSPPPGQSNSGGGVMQQEWQLMMQGKALSDIALTLNVPIASVIQDLASMGATISPQEAQLATQQYNAYSTNAAPDESSLQQPGTTTTTGNTGNNPDVTDPGWRLRDPRTWTPQEADIYLKEQQASNNAANNYAASSASSSAAADLAEKIREFNITEQRDIAKENATEIDSLQKLLSGLTGPKDPYGYLYWSRGMTPPQGLAPANVPFTDAQLQAWLAANPGKTRQDLVNQFTGGGVPPLWAQAGGVLGNMPQSMNNSQPLVSNQQQQGGQTNTSVPPTTQPPPSTNPGLPPRPSPYGQPPPGQPGGTPPQGQPGMPPRPSPQGVFGNTPPAPPAPSAQTRPSPLPGQTPTMAEGGQVPGQPGTPTLAVLHGKETVTPAGQTPQPTDKPGDTVDNSNVHPAIAKLLSALSELLANPDFAQFVGQLNPGSQPPQMPGQGQPMQQGQPGPQMPGNVQTLAAGGNVNPAASPVGTPPPPPPAAPLQNVTPGGGALGSQGMAFASNNPLPADQSIQPLSITDPYSQALYDRMGRLHPYSAQQEAQMGPSGVAAVQNYVSRIEGADINDYTNLVDRLRPQGAPSAGDVQGESFLTG